MFSPSLLFCICFVQFSNSGGLFGLIFGYQKLCFCRCGMPYKVSERGFGRILGGESTATHQFPWLATIRTGTQVVTGALVSDRHVITSASRLHGVPNERIKVTMGSTHGGLIVDTSLSVGVDMVYVHPGFTPAHMISDLSLLRLRHVVPFSQYISPVCLPTFGNQESEQVAWIASWSDDSLNSTCNPRVVALPIVPSRTCNKVTGIDEKGSGDKGCLGPLGTKSAVCDSDTGAPVMSRWSAGAAFRLIGVISSASCDSTAPALYTRISDHITWIHDHIRSDCQCF